MKQTNCPECKGPMKEVTQPGFYFYIGGAIPVHESFYRCVDCGEEVVTAEQAGKKEAEAVEVYTRMNKEGVWPD